MLDTQVAESMRPHTLVWRTSWSSYQFSQRVHRSDASPHANGADSSTLYRIAHPRRSKVSAYVPAI